MSIASRIEQIEQHISDDYSILTLGGADLTNVDKNIQNLKTQWKSRLEYYLANGLDVVWNNWNKITRSGITLSLNDTIQASMKIVYGGNTSQETTTGKNLAKEEFDSEYYLSGSGDNRTVANAVYKVSEIIQVQPSTTYTISGRFTDFTDNVIRIAMFDNLPTTGSTSTKYIASATSPYTFTTDTNTTYIMIWESGGTSDTTIYHLQLEKGSTATTYEPYVGGIPSPNPDYPQDIHIVSGDNEIVVCGKNLIDNILNNNITQARCTFSYDNGEIVVSATGSDAYIGEVCNQGNAWNNTKGNLVLVEPNTQYTFKITNSLFTKNFISFYDSNKISTKQPQYITNSTGTITTDNDTKYISIRTGYANSVSGTNYKLNIMLNIGSSESTYEPYQSQTYPINLPDGMELCKIGDYQDIIKKSTGKNLFDKGNMTTDYYLDSTGTPVSSTFWDISNYIKVKPNTKYTYEGLYTIGSNAVQCVYYNANKEIISVFKQATGTNTITTPNNCYYIRFSINKYTTNDKDTFMINEGSTALPYEPYGTGWYVKKETGKVVYTGAESENWMTFASVNYEYQIPFATKGSSDTESQFFISLSNKFKNNNVVGASLNDYEYSCFVSGEYRWFRIRYNAITTLANFKTWLSNNNPIFYYVLATPTYTEITYQPLIDQLNLLEQAQSKDNQTNIIQDNNDLPFELDVTALKDLDVEDIHLH